MWSSSNTLLRKCQGHWRPHRTICDGNVLASKATRVPFVLSTVEPKTAGTAEKHWVWVFTVVQYEDQKCIMNVHHHGWGYSLPSLSSFHVFSNLLSYRNAEASLQYLMPYSIVYVRSKLLKKALTDTFFFFFFNSFVPLFHFNLT